MKNKLFKSTDRYKYVGPEKNFIATLWKLRRSKSLKETIKKYMNF